MVDYVSAEAVCVVLILLTLNHDVSNECSIIDGGSN